LGFAVDGETRSIAAFQRVYQTATNQTVVRSSFYDRFTPELRDLLRILSFPQPGVEIINNRGHILLI